MSTLEARKAVRVLLVEDSLPVRKRIRSLIEESCSAEVVGEAGSVAAANFLLHSHPVDAVVLDLHLWDGDGGAVLTMAKGIHPDCVVIVLTSFSEAADRTRCLELGADYFFDKTREFERVPAVLAGLGRDLERKGTLKIGTVEPCDQLP
jgi:DNA-binding NarL/FixJ family response regulator